MAKFVRIVLGLIVVASAAAAGVFGTQWLLAGDDGGGEERGGGPVRVGVSQPAVAQIEDIVSGVGTLRPVAQVDLKPATPGRVTEVAVTSGQRVEPGDLLVQLDDRATRAALDEARATQTETEAEFGRFQDLEDSNVAAEARLEEVRAAYERAQAGVLSAQAALDDRTLRAPFGGTLGLIDLEPGAFVTSETVVTLLSDLSSVEVDLSLPERYFDRIAPGQVVTITTPAYPGETFEGEVEVQAPQIELTTRSFDLRARIENPDGRLVGGMFANAELVLDTYEGLAIPDDAIISEGLTSYVFVVGDGTAARTDVVPGAALGALTEVRDGLSETDRVVVAGWDRLSDGDEVEIDEDFAQEGLE